MKTVIMNWMYGAAWTGWKNPETQIGLEDARKWIEIVKQYSEPTELTAELLNNMFNKIVVHEAVKYDNGFHEQKIEIYYRFVGKID